MPTRTYTVAGALLILEKLSADPATGQVAQLYYNTTLDRPKVYTAT